MQGFGVLVARNEWLVIKIPVCTAMVSYVFSVLLWCDFLSSTSTSQVHENLLIIYFCNTLLFQITLLVKSTMNGPDGSLLLSYILCGLSDKKESEEKRFKVRLLSSFFQEKFWRSLIRWGELCCFFSSIDLRVFNIHVSVILSFRFEP